MTPNSAEGQFVDDATSEAALETSIDEIYWEGDEVYIHVSGMRYDPEAKKYFTWLNLDPEDLRALY